MKRIALISCTKLKENFSCKAKDMYAKSDLFKYSYKWALDNADEIYILSSKYGLVNPEQVIETYDETLKDKSFWERKIWADIIAYNLSKVSSLNEDKFLILAGRDYYENLINEVKNYELPLGSLRYAERIEYLKEQVSASNRRDYTNNTYSKNTEGNSYKLHELFNGLKRYNYSNIDEIPFNNGIYIVFEKGEKYDEFDKVVRVGTHRSDNRLKIRLKQHFIKENKDDSIFRKNIGRAILNCYNDEYLKVWNIDFKNIELKRMYSDKRDLDKELLLEQRITRYLKEKLSFICFEVKTKEERLRIEEGIIATLNNDTHFLASEKWAGKYSPIKEIKESGLWLVQGLDGQVLNDYEFKKIKELCNVNYKEEIIISKDLSTPNKSYSDQIREYIIDEMNKAKSRGEESIIFISGEINKALNFIPHRNPQISRIMWELRKEQDEVLFTTPSGQSSTIKIKYYL